jgi:hypothetical protein
LLSFVALFAWANFDAQADNLPVPVKLQPVPFTAISYFAWDSGGI